MTSATNLVGVVDSYAIIRPGVTERTLRDLQLTIDILDETSREIKDEPVPGEEDDAGAGNHDAQE